MGKVGDPEGRRGTPGRSVLRVAWVQPGFVLDAEDMEPQCSIYSRYYGMLELLSSVDLV